MLEKFKKIIEDEGGEVDLDKLAKGLKETFEDFANRAKKSIDSVVLAHISIHNIEFCLIDCDDFNAFADGSKGEYVIGINIGVISTLTLIFDRLFIEKSFMPYIGDVTKEKANPPIISSEFHDSDKLRKSKLLIDSPICSDRRYYSNHFTRLALDWILAHELTHIINGHVDLYSNTFGLRLDEIGSRSQLDSDQYLATKTLELDADQGATRILLGSELNKVLGNFPKPELLFDVYTSPGIILLQFSIITSLIFKIFGDQRLDPSTFALEPYPRPRLRNFICLQEISKIKEFQDLNAKHNYDFTRYGIPLAADAGFKTLESEFEKITGIKSNSASISDAWGDIGKVQINELCNNWNGTLISELKKFAHLNLQTKNLLE